MAMPPMLQPTTQSRGDEHWDENSLSSYQKDLSGLNTRYQSDSKGCITLLLHVRREIYDIESLIRAIMQT